MNHVKISLKENFENKLIFLVKKEKIIKWHEKPDHINFQAINIFSIGIKTMLYIVNYYIVIKSCFVRTHILYT